MNTFTTVTFLGAGAATTAQVAILTASAEKPRTIDNFRVLNNSADPRWIRAWANGQLIADVTVDPKNVVNLCPSPLGIQESQTLDIQGEVDDVLLWQLHGQ